jgi:hypothetical protein
MGAFTVTTVRGAANLQGRMKMAVIDCTGPASYDTGGSIIDLSTSGVAGADGFTSVHGVQIIQSTAANSLQLMRYVRVAAATGLLKVNDGAAAADAEVSAATNLSGNTYTLLVTGY